MEIFIDCLIRPSFRKSDMGSLTGQDVTQERVERRTAVGSLADVGRGWFPYLGLGTQRRVDPIFNIFT